MNRKVHGRVLQDGSDHVGVIVFIRENTTAK